MRRGNDILNKTIGIKYQTKRIYCPCCNQKLSTPKISDTKDFRIDKDTTESWTDWKAIAECDDDLDATIDEFIFDTIDFFATAEDKLLIDKSESNKVKQFVLDNIINIGN
jgi:hypothetical protein